MTIQNALFKPCVQAAYKAQADQIIQTQAALNDTQKMITELFDNKLRGFGAVPILQYYLQFGWRLEDAVAFDAATHAVGHTWHTSALVTALIYCLVVCCLEVYCPWCIIYRSCTMPPSPPGP
jgi:hypothetical protein